MSSRFYLTPAMRIKIAKLLASGLSAAAIADRFGISVAHVYRAAA